MLLRRVVTRTGSHRSLATLDAVHNVDDFQRLARDKLERPLYEYLASGSGDEVTLRENRAAFGRYALRPRALRGVPRKISQNPRAFFSDP